MNKTRTIVAGIALASALAMPVFADDLQFNTKDGPVSYTENADIPSGISFEDLMEFNQKEADRGRDLSVTMDFDVDVNMLIGDNSSMGMFIDMGMVQENKGDVVHYESNTDIEVFGQKILEQEEAYSWKENGRTYSYSRRTDEEGNMSDWEIDEDSDLVAPVGNLEEGLEGFKLLDNIYSDEEGNAYYVAQTYLNPNEDNGSSMQEMMDDLISSMESMGIELSDPILLTAMFRTEDCALSKMYMDISGLEGSMDGTAMGSEQDIKVVYDTLNMVVSADEKVEDIEIPSELTWGRDIDMQPEKVEETAIMLGDEIRRLPCNVSDLIDAGWEIDLEYTGEEKMAPGDYSYLDMEKDGDQIEVWLYNEANYNIENTDATVYAISAQSYSNQNAGIYDGIVKLGMSREDMVEALENAGISYVAEDEDEYGYQNFRIYGNSEEDPMYSISTNEDEVWMIEASAESELLYVWYDSVKFD